MQDKNAQPVSEFQMQSASPVIQNDNNVAPSFNDLEFERKNQLIPNTLATKNNIVKTGGASSLTKSIQKKTLDNISEKGSMEVVSSV